MKPIEDFIRENKEKFDENFINEHHEEKFLIKLVNRFKKIINIVPYLLRVLVVTIIIFILSIWVWNSYIRKDRHEVTLKEKINNVLIIKK